jgi:hypothetical protein
MALIAARISSEIGLALAGTLFRPLLIWEILSHGVMVGVPKTPYGQAND